MAQPMSRNVPSRCTGARISSLASRHNCESPSKPDCHRGSSSRSEEHTSELQSRSDLVCRLLLEKKKKKHKHRVRQKKNKTERPSAADKSHRNTESVRMNDRALIKDTRYACVTTYKLSRCRFRST